jgi:hypothetical protein
VSERRDSGLKRWRATGSGLGRLAGGQIGSRPVEFSNGARTPGTSAPLQLALLMESRLA